jgi:hypothetical protein
MIDVRRASSSLSPAIAGLFFFTSEKAKAIIAILRKAQCRAVNFHATQWFVIKAR